MTFTETYTTERFVLADTSNTEKNKVKVTEDSYLNAKMMENLISMINFARKH